MSEKLPFEEAFENRINGTSLSGEDASWEQMKALLDAEEKDRKTIPFWLSYRGLNIAATVLLITTAGYFIIQHITPTYKGTIISYEEAGSSKKKEKISTNTDQSVSSNEKVNTKETVPLLSTKKLEKNNQSFNSSTIKSNKTPVVKNQKQPALLMHNQKPEKQNVSGTTSSYSLINTYETTYQQGRTGSMLESGRKLSPTFLVLYSIENLNKVYIISDSIQHDFLEQNASLQKTNPFASDSMIFPNNKESKTAFQKKYSVSIGLGLKQQIPLGGQVNGAYNYNGKQNLISDYIPSLFVRFEKQNKWFVQGEFKYASPRMVKEFDYEKQTDVNFANGNIVTNTASLKKTYYHQLPISFNMYIKKDWSAGAGIMFNWLQSTVTQNQTDTSDLFYTLQASSRMVSPVKGFTDSFLTRSHTSILLQSDYYLNRFSFGLRYSYDLDPYIKYTLPDGRLNSKQGYALDLIVRFRIYRSRKF